MIMGVGGLSLALSLIRMAKGCKLSIILVKLICSLFLSNSAQSFYKHKKKVLKNEKNNT